MNKILGIGWLLTPVSLLAAPAVRTVTTPSAVLHLDAASCDLVGLDWKQPSLQVITERIRFGN